MTVNAAIIGLGIMGRRMLEHMERHPGYQPVALWDPDPAACREALALAPGRSLRPRPRTPSQRRIWFTLRAHLSRAKPMRLRQPRLARPFSWKSPLASTSPKARHWSRG